MNIIPYHFPSSFFKMPQVIEEVGEKIENSIPNIVENGHGENGTSDELTTNEDTANESEAAIASSEINGSAEE